MNNGYMVYLLRILAVQGALASVYTDPEDPEGFAAGFIEAVDGQHVLMCDLTPWGQIDGWRVRRNADVLQVLYGEEYEQRLAMLMAYHKQRHRPFFTDAPAEDTDLLLSVWIRSPVTASKSGMAFSPLLSRYLRSIRSSRRSTSVTRLTLSDNSFRSSFSSMTFYKYALLFSICFFTISMAF